VEEQPDQQQELRPGQQEHQSLRHERVIPAKIVTKTVA
jgi:hypothetical protein